MENTQIIINKRAQLVFLEEKMKKKLISQLVCVTIALSLTSVSALAEETNAAAEVNEGAAEGKEEGKTEPQEAPKEEVDVSQGGIYAEALL